MAQVGVPPGIMPYPHSHMNVNQGGKLTKYSDVFQDLDTIANVLSDHNKAIHDALNINAGQVDGEEAADIVTNARVKAHFPDTIANILSDHNKAIHDALKIKSGFLGPLTLRTIDAAGAITVDPAVSNFYKVETFGGGAISTLNNIYGGEEGMTIVLKANHTNHTISVTGFGGNIARGVPGYELDDDRKTLALIYDGGLWRNASTQGI